MIDKKKLAIILSAVGVCTIALIIAIIWAVTTLAGNDNNSDPATAPSTSQPASPTPTPTVTEEPNEEDEPGPSTDVPPLEEELQATAENAAARAAIWNGASERSALESKYESAGFSDELVKSYESVWATVYDDPAVGRYDDAAGSLRVETFASIVSSEVRDVRGEEGDRLYVVAVKIHYDAQWTDRNGAVHLGGVQSESQGDAVWGATVSEKTGEVVQIDDPPATNLIAPQID
ncbi:MAG: hypothetical protein ACTH8F_09725 [Microbacterium sp.]|uniref:hypothetical protein n=1 Tax=Microbacterium sp. TaxID=51671 RepID=UPI003F99FF58